MKKQFRYTIYRTLTRRMVSANMLMPLQNQWPGLVARTERMAHGAYRRFFSACQLWRAVRGTPSGVPGCLRSPVDQPAYGPPPIHLVVDRRTSQKTRSLQ